MTISKRLSKLEKIVSGHKKKIAGYAIANGDGTFYCPGANVTTRAEYKAYIEEMKKPGGYRIKYIME